MDNKRKIKILASSYRKDLKVFKWDVVEVETNKKISVVVPAKDLINIDISNMDIPNDVIDNFNKNIIGKELFLASEYVEQKVEELKGAEAEKMLEKHNEVDQFPLYEAYQIAESEKDNK